MLSPANLRKSTALAAKWMGMVPYAMEPVSWKRSNWPASPPSKMKPAVSLLACTMAFHRKTMTPAMRKVMVTLLHQIMKFSLRQITTI